MRVIGNLSSSSWAVESFEKEIFSRKAEISVLEGYGKGLGALCTFYSTGDRGILSEGQQHDLVAASVGCDVAVTLVSRCGVEALEIVDGCLESNWTEVNPVQLFLGSRKAYLSHFKEPLDGAFLSDILCHQGPGQAPSMCDFLWSL